MILHHVYTYSEDMTLGDAQALLQPDEANSILLLERTQRITYLAQVIGESWERHAMYKSVGLMKYARCVGLVTEAYQTLLEITTLETLKF